MRTLTTRRALTLIILCAVPLLVSAAESQPPQVAWSQTQPVTWDLFQATPPGDAAQRNEAAAIHMTLTWHATFTASCSDGTHWTGSVSSVVVTNTMEPTLSWVVPGRQNPDVLHHAQSHFDLSEVYRRKIELSLQRVASCQALTEQGAFDQLKSQASQTASALLQKLSDMTDLYDTQTCNGTDPGEQARWDALIRGWLSNPLSAP
jgi:hypothetical protein